MSLVAGVTVDRQARLRSAGVAGRRDLARLHHPTASARTVEPDLADMIVQAHSGTHRSDDPVGALWRRDRPARRRDLAALGVRTVGDVARLDVATATVDVGRRLPQLIDQARVQIVGEPHLTRTASVPSRCGQDVVGGRRDVELHTDLEHDGDLLIGVGCTVRTADQRLRWLAGHHWFSLFAHPDVAPSEGSARAFAAFWNWQDRLVGAARRLELTVGHLVYSDAERRTLVGLAERCAPSGQGTPAPQQVADAFDGHWTDLHRLLTDRLLRPAGDTRLKTLAGDIAGFRWRDPEPSGANCVAWFRRARIAQRTGDRATFARLRSRIADYNADDCAGQAHLVGWLHRRLSGDGPALQPVAALDDDPRFR